MKYAIQLYSVRDYTEKDFEGAIKAVAELGYNAVEFAGFFGKTPEEINALLKENCLENYGAHASLEDLLNDYESTVNFHKAIHTPFYVIPCYDLSDKEKIDKFVNVVNEVQPKLAADGITLAYHNHAAEFLKNADGSKAFTELYSRTNLNFQIDVFWAHVAGENPVPLIKKLGNRVCSIHLKDGFSGGEGNPLGQGEVSIKEICNYIKNTDILPVVESETCHPDGITEAKICIEYLK